MQRCTPHYFLKIEKLRQSELLEVFGFVDVDAFLLL